MQRIVPIRMYTKKFSINPANNYLGEKHIGNRKELNACNI
jgi:hypothetical protein